MAALDIIVVRHPDGTLCSSDWRVVFRSAVPEVRVSINGTALPERMRSAAADAPAQFGDGDAETPRLVPSEATLRALLESGAMLPGRNAVSYTPAMGGKGEGGEGSHGIGDGAAHGAVAHLHLWESSTAAVVFDVDGTVTQADISGHIGQQLGVPLLHRGVCELACRLEARGYAVFFLSARPLAGPTGIASTRHFLFRVARDSPSGFGARQQPKPAAQTRPRHVHGMSTPRPQASRPARCSPRRTPRR